MALGDIAKMGFNFQEFWVRIYNVPLIGVSKEMVGQVGERVGQVVDVDLGGLGLCSG